MLYRAYRPAPPLAAFVDYMWALRDAPAHATERIVPSGTLELVVNLHEDAVRVYDIDTRVWRRYSGAVVSGAYRRFFVIDPRDHVSIVGVHFRPGEALPFLPVAPGELADRHADLAMLWGRAALELRERLCAAPTVAERFGLLEAALCSRPVDGRPGHPVVPFALVQLPGRALRFQRATDLAHRIAAPDWGRLARACGYFDQSHLIHDVIEFTGASPRQLRPASEAVKELHLAGPDEVKFLQDSERARQ